LTFQVDASALEDVEQMGLRGGTPPLSWDKSIPMQDPRGHGYWEATVVFDSFPDLLEFKFIANEATWELGMQNRFLAKGWTRMLKEPLVWDRTLPLPDGIAPRIRSEALQADLALLEKGLRTMHPAPERYLDKAGLDGLFAQYRARFARPHTHAEAFWAFSQLAAALRCGHTHVNLFNQDGLVKQLVLDRADKLPLAFRWVDGRAFVTRTASPEGHVPLGSEILSIQGVPLQDIRDTLLSAAKTDGNNSGQALQQLSLNGLEQYEVWDAYQPLLFPPEEGQYRIRFVDPQGAERASIVQACSRAERRAQWRRQGLDLPETVDDTWTYRRTEDGLAILTLGTFSIWSMEMDWKKFLDRSFQDMKSAKIRALILDIRQNEGGADEVIEVLARHLLREDVLLDQGKARIAYQRLPEDLRTYAQSWQDDYLNWGDAVVPDGQGNYTWAEEEGPMLWRGNRKAYDGPLYVLVGPQNSSATFYLARALREAGRATLAGSETGGNLQALNGGIMAFFRLPNSRMEVDIPLLGTVWDTAEQGGLQPDWSIPPSVDAARAGEDGVMTELLRQVREAHP
jgi:hypothetical protein